MSSLESSFFSLGNRCTHEWIHTDKDDYFFCKDHRVQKLLQSNLSVKRNMLLAFQRDPCRAIVIFITASDYEPWVQGMKVGKIYWKDPLFLEQCLSINISWNEEQILAVVLLSLCSLGPGSGRLAYLKENKNGGRFKGSCISPDYFHFLLRK